ncbi:internalin [Flavobacterium sp. 316]|nr:T9SS type A sorting domain-containing protein [Flavobacterium sp. 316]KIX22786.1 internalin [Flavobacterium sp. 316]
MKKLYFLLFVLFGLHVHAQIVNIPDANFKAKLLSANSTNTIAKDLTGEWFKIDANNDGEIQESEALQVSYLAVTDSNIANLDGLNYFNNLTNLDCARNILTDIDVNQNILLETFSFSGNQLTTIDLSQNIKLKHLAFSGNQFVTIDLSSNNELVSLWFSYNPLTFISIKNTKIITATTFSNCPNLVYICANENQIPDLRYKIQSYGYNNCEINSYCSFVPGGEYFLIEGEARLDNNLNGCDILDVDYENLYFNHFINGNLVGAYISNSTGFYSIPVQEGSHTITPNLENPTYFNISPTSLTVDFPTQASPFTQDFCVTANGVHSDVEVVILPTVPARPGFDAKYKISYRNKGNQVENGSVSLTFEDTVLDYLSSNPVFNSATTNSYTWNYSNLQPFETREIEVFFNVNSPMETPAVNIDDVLNYTATIATSNTDETPDDNEFTLNQIVVGSYDPNDKTCLEGETVGPNMIGEYVHYLIRFENTGTYPAENVVVKDMIDLTKFDLSTLIPLKGSHEFYTRIKDNKVEFIFENINLDFNDATNDGYVAFKIKTKSNLTVGSAFSNNANIYFDYNFPITTNTYTTTIQALSIQDFDFSSKFTLYPNPVQDVLHFNSKENITIQSVEIYNMLGQVVLTVPNATKSIDVSNLTKGNYFVKVNTEKGSSNTKFVKK